MKLLKVLLCAALLGVIVGVILFLFIAMEYVPAEPGSINPYNP